MFVKQHLLLVLLTISMAAHAQIVSGTDTPSSAAVQEYYYKQSEANSPFHGSSYYTSPNYKQGFHVDLGIGYSSSTDLLSTAPATINYQTFRFQLQYTTHNKFSIILDAQFRIAFTLTTDPDIYFSTDEWVMKTTDTPNDILSKYLPIIQMRYGNPSDDVYFQLGFLSDITLGNGFLVQDYSNSLDIINRRISGIFTRVDARAFDFPYVGVELLFGDIAQLDTFVTRLFFRPLYFLQNSYFHEMIVGVSFGMNRNEFSSLDGDLFSGIRGGDITYIAGGDLLLPVIANKNLQIEVQADYLWQGDSNNAARAGARWKIFNFFILHTNFVYLSGRSYANYFDRNFQQTGIEQSIRAGTLLNDPQRNGYFWEAYATLSFFNDGLQFGGFARAPFLFDTATLNQAGGITAGFNLRIIEGRIKALQGLSLSLHYVKNNIYGMDDLASITDAFIGGKLGIQARGIRIEILAELRPRYQILPELLQIHAGNLAQIGLDPTRAADYTALPEYSVYMGILGAISF